MSDHPTTDRMIIHQPIGADVVYSWRGEVDDGFRGYISFDDTQYDPEVDYPEFDKFGIRDDEIFFSVSADTFKEWTTNPTSNEEDFVIHTFTYRYNNGGV